MQFCGTVGAICTDTVQIATKARVEPSEFLTRVSSRVLDLHRGCSRESHLSHAWQDAAGVVQVQHVRE